MNVRIIFRILGILLLLEGAAIGISLGVAAIYREHDLNAFALAMLINLVFGTLMVFLTKKARKEIRHREGYLIVTLVWIVFSAFGSLPYILSGVIPSFTDAFFETMSGFSTTGSSILNNIEELPHGILFWRSLTQWLGGMGIIVLSMAILPIFGIGSNQLFDAEAPGPTVDRITPRISDTAKMLWLIYVGFTAMETLLLALGGMSLFDAVCHSFTTMATGGFSTKQASIAYWQSPYIQYVITIFMFVAGVNFNVHFFAIKGKFKNVFRDEEFRFYGTITAIFTLVIFAGLLVTTSLPGEQAFRDAVFQVVSVITTTGFATMDYMTWTTPLVTILFLLFFFGGSTGSTGGGIKIMRIGLLFKNGLYELRRLVHPRAVIPARFNHQTVNHRMLINTLAFFMFYISIFAIGTVILTFTNLDIESAMGASATALGNIGPGLGSLGPAYSFSETSGVAKWTLSALMLLGRLELFTVLVIFSPSFWKK